MAELVERILRTFPGTPEELGALMYDATMPVACPDDAERKYRARRLVSEHDGGKELIELEERLLDTP